MRKRARDDRTPSSWATYRRKAEDAVADAEQVVLNASRFSMWFAQPWATGWTLDLKKEQPCSPQSNLRRAWLLTVAQSVLTFSGAQWCDPAPILMEQTDEVQNDTAMDHGGAIYLQSGRNWIARRPQNRFCW
jgi:hypothetical protein